LPSLGGAGAAVDAGRCVEPRTGLALAIAATVALAAAALLVLSITGAVIAGVMLLVQYVATRRALTVLRASSLRVGPSQLAPIHECASAFARRLSLPKVPEIYVLDAAEVNGFALLLGRRSGVFLTDEAVAACLEGRRPGALAFVIGHELAHFALGHQSWWRRPLRRSRWLSRLDECSADNVACELVGSHEAAEDGVLLLAAGPRLLSYVDRAAARAQAAEVAGDRATRRAERTLTHPVTMRRLERVGRRFAGRSLRAAA
jgi:Zn-dependent protease with chaperone function